LRRVASTYHEHLGEGDGKVPAHVNGELVSKLAAMNAEDKKSAFYSIKASLLESGMILYVHTIAGGALWGLMYSVYDKAPPRTILRNMFRTSLVTGLVPAYFIGGCVSLFRHYHRECDTHSDLFNLYAATTYMTVQPWFYLLPVLESWSPLWLGGHIVGFMSFFIYMRVSDSDILKNDEQLRYADKDEKLPLFVKMWDQARKTKEANPDAFKEQASK